MIGRLKGKIADKSPEGAVVDAGGVGYDVALPLSTLAALPPAGEEVTLWIHTHVREEELRLFGFGSRRDRAAFRTMLKVGGVGPKVALAVIGALSGDQLARAVDTRDARRLTSIPGIGKKTAERIILELGGKLAEPGEAPAPAAGLFGDLAAALKNLGFKPAQVDAVVRDVQGKGDQDRPFEDLLREALALLQSR